MTYFKWNFIIILVVSCILKTNAQLCSQSHDFNDLLQTGFYTLANALSNQRQHCYTVLISNYNPADKTLQAIASTGRIQKLQSSTSLGLDYFIRTSIGKANAQVSIKISVIINEDNRWTTIKVSYMISSRRDFRIGYFIPSQISTSGCQNNSSSGFLSHYVIPEWKKISQNKFQFIYLISGLQIKNRFSSIGITWGDFNQNSGLISINIQAISNIPPQYIQISYIVFQSQNWFFAAEYDPLNFVISDQSINYYFQGINQFQRNNGIASQGYSFKKNPILQCIGKMCTENCMNRQKCALINGNIYVGKCYLCSQNQTFQKGNCIQNVQNTNCLTNEYFNGKQCICIINFVRTNGICQRACPYLTYDNGRECVCVPGYANVSGSCLPQCPQNSYLTPTYVCLCNDGYILNSAGKCVLTNCPANQVYNSTSGFCQCRAGYLRNKNICELKCPSNFQNAVVVNGACVCIQTFVLVNGNCNCPSNYYLSNGSCFLNVSCPANSAYNNASKTCICIQPGFTIINGVCQNSGPGLGLVVVCPINAVLVQGICICNRGFYLNGSICSPCFFSCATCQNKTNSGCLSCINSYILRNGQCIKLS